MHKPVLKLSLIIASFFCLNSSVLALPPAPINSTVNPANTATQLSRHTVVILPVVNRIIASGTINYQIKVGGKSNYMNIEDPTIFQYKIIHNTLYLNYHTKETVKHIVHPLKEPITIKLHLSSLTHLRQLGKSNINLVDTSNQPLRIKKSGSGSLSVTGHAVNLVTLENTGLGNIVIHNINNASSLQIKNNGQGTVYLSGTNVRLAKLTTYNSGGMIIRHVHSQHLYLSINTASTIKLSGVYTIAHLNFSGSGSLQLYWVKNSNLTVTSYGSGRLALAGVVKILNVAAHDTSHVDLRYLRARKIFVKSYENAAVDVYPLEDLHAVAFNNSNIYYYHKPVFLAGFMKQDGTVLPMWNIYHAILSFEPSDWHRL